MFLSLFEQSVAELRVARLVYDAIDSEAKGKRDYDLTDLLEAFFAGLKVWSPTWPQQHLYV